MDRLEFILAPAELIRTALPSLLRQIGETLDDPRTQLFTIGRYLLIVCGDGAEALPREPHEKFAIREGWWPEPVGVQIEAANLPVPCWSVQPDRLAVRPVFHWVDASGDAIVATRPEIIAALTDARLSAEALAEQLLVGFHVDDQCVFDGIHRVRAGEILWWEATDGFCITTSNEVPPALKKPRDHDWVDAIAPVIVEAFERGDALELSAGVDSRLVLAIGLAHKARPHLAFTLGGCEEDVTIASEICRVADIRHEVVPVEIGSNDLADQGRRFAQRSGFGISVSSYAWLPSAFARLADLRTAQIGGGGGECAAGFYYSPLDGACALGRVVQSAWVRRRLFRSGVRLGEYFAAPRAVELQRFVEETALRVLRGTAGSWRERSDAFYLSQRVPNAGGAVLSACACWYRPLQPLLRAPYIEWGRQCPTRYRAYRRAQMRIMDELAPEIASIPFSHGRRFARGANDRLTLAFHNIRSAGRKIRNRLSHRQPAPDLGAAMVAEALASDERTRASLRRLPEEIVGLDPAGIDCIIADPGHYEHELGTLLNVAFAADAATGLRRELREGVQRMDRIAA